VAHAYGFVPIAHAAGVLASDPLAERMLAMSITDIASVEAVVGN
jgi:hypothetical protein